MLNCRRLLCGLHETNFAAAILTFNDALESGGNLALRALLALDPDFHLPLSLVRQLTSPCSVSLPDIERPSSFEAACLNIVHTPALMQAHAESKSGGEAITAALGRCGP
jgi:hypothetical protein